MRFVLRISAAADADVAAISRWIEESGSSQAADRWDAGIRDAIESLAVFPERCPLAPESRRIGGVSVHQLFAGTYRILFVVDGRTVMVLHVRHARRSTTTADDLSERLRRASDAAE